MDGAWCHPALPSGSKALVLQLLGVLPADSPHDFYPFPSKSCTFPWGSPHPVIGECRVKGPHASPQLGPALRNHRSCSAPCGYGRGLAVTTSEPSFLCSVLLLSFPPQVLVPGVLPSQFPVTNLCLRVYLPENHTCRSIQISVVS